MELFVLDAVKRGTALPIGPELLAELDDPRLPPELNRYNLEINLTPLKLAGAPFAALESELAYLLNRLNEAAALRGGEVATVGILPAPRDSAETTQ